MNYLYAYSDWQAVKKEFSSYLYLWSKKTSLSLNTLFTLNDGESTKKDWNINQFEL